MKVISIDGHPRQEELVAYVSNTLDPDDAARIEDHVFECSLCATRLQEAARFQMLLHDAAAAMAVEPAPVASPQPRRRWRTSAMGGLWAAAAAVVLMVCQQSGQTPVEPDQGSATSMVAQTAEIMANGGAPFIDREPAMGDGLIASFEPLESVDPLQTWPDDRFAGTQWATEQPLDGEPCGSGEDGGTLVCQPFSG
ncbi:MAG: zf-HC2 domain-containing protein [Myxococcota bacterium]